MLYNTVYTSFSNACLSTNFLPSAVLQTLQCNLHSVESRISNFRKDCEKYAFVDGGTEMQRYISELEDKHDEVAEALKHLMLDLESELERTENYSSYYQVLSVALYCYPHMPIGKVWIYRLLFVFCVCVCTVTDFSSEDTASVIKFCMVVHRRPGQAISHFGDFAPPETQNWTKYPVCKQRLFTVLVEYMYI